MWRPRVRFTVRRMMIAVAIVGLGLGGETARKRWFSWIKPGITPERDGDTGSSREIEQPKGNSTWQRRRGLLQTGRSI